VDKHRAILSGAGAVIGRGGPKTINKTASGKNHSLQCSANFAAQCALTPLRLIRVRIGNFRLGDLAAGQWRILKEEERELVVKSGTGLRPVC
jgi:hypothetical protein